MSPFSTGFSKTASVLRGIRQTASLLTSKPARTGALYGAVGGAVSGAANAPEGEGLDGALKGALLGGAAGGIGGAGYRRMQSMDRLEKLQKRNKSFGTAAWSKRKNPASWYEDMGAKPPGQPKPRKKVKPPASTPEASSET